MDKIDTGRNAENGDGQGIYFPSYTMPNYNLEDPFSGLTSIVNGAGTTGTHLFKLSDVNVGSRKLMIVEEHTLRSKGESPDPNNDTGSLVNDGRFVPDGDLLSARHNGKADCVFVDGHTSPVKPLDIKNQHRIFCDPLSK